MTRVPAHTHNTQTNVKNLNLNSTIPSLFFFFLFKELFLICIYVNMKCRCHEGQRGLKLQVVVGQHMGAWKWTRVLCKPSLQYLCFGNESSLGFMPFQTTFKPSFYYFLLWFVSLCGPGCHGTRFVDQVGLEFAKIQLVASASKVLGLRVCITTTRQGFLFF